MDDYTPTRQLWWGLTLRMIGSVLLVLAGLNCLSAGLFDYCFIGKIGKPWSQILYILIGVAALLFAFDRDYYLSFLGRCATPCASLTERVPDGASIQVSVRVPPNAKVLYWAAEPEDHIVDNPWSAYRGYDNSGVVVADSTGLAVLKVRSPAQYQVGAMHTTLARHVHYRYCENGGMTSPVYTVKLH